MGTVKNIFDFNDAPLQHQVKEEPFKDPLREFRRAMADGGYIVSGEIIEDSRIHRFDGPEDKPGKKSGWYVFYPDKIPAGAWGSWKTEETVTWCAKVEREMTPQERADHHTRIERVRAARDEELAKVNAEAKEKAQEVWEAAPEVLAHPYLAKKEVLAFGLRLHQGRLLIPIRDNSGAIQSYQTIAADGEKRFLSGGAKKGNFFTIPGEGKTAIAEGYATAASIHMATGWTVLVAFDAGNLRPVAEAWRKEHPSGEIVVCGDNDASGVGQAKAKEAAEAVHGRAACPQEEGKDWNDVHARDGNEEVRRQMLPPLPFKMLTFEELLQREYVHDPIIGGLLDQKESLLITGRCGIGKSLFALTIALELARDKFQNPMDFNDNRLFGQFPITKSYNCLFIQSENTAKATQDRLRKILAAKPEYRSGGARLHAPEIRDDIRMTGFLSDGNFRMRIRQMIEARNIGVLILDPLISYHDGDENDNAEMRRNLDHLTELMDETNVATIVVHHSGKDNSRGGGMDAILSSRGASSVADWTANFLALSLEKKDKKKLVLSVEHAKARNFETVPKFQLERDKNLALRLFEKKAKPKDQELEAVLIKKIVEEVRLREEAGEAPLTTRVLSNSYPARWKEEIPGANKTAIRVAVDVALLNGALFEVKKYNPKNGKTADYLSTEFPTGFSTGNPADNPADGNPADGAKSSGQILPSADNIPELLEKSSGQKSSGQNFLSAE